MANTRMNLLPNKRFLDLHATLIDHLANIARLVDYRNFPSLCDAGIFRWLNGVFASVGATEGSIWLLDQEKEHLVIAYNSGPNAEKLLGFKQPLSRGLLGTVFATEQGLVENKVYQNAQHDHQLNRMLRQTTYAMIVVPFYFLNERRGVISCVQLVDIFMEPSEAISAEMNPSGFTGNDVTVLKDAAAILRELVDFRLLQTTVGWNPL
ncbi:MAG: hypothetical protein JO066_08690 [Verrucomicrobia bacterium]|nr:hypothetical protein [Verrucomicrobiota bacterium]